MIIRERERDVRERERERGLKGVPVVLVLLGGRMSPVLRWDPSVRTVLALLVFLVHPENNNSSIIDF